MKVHPPENFLNSQVDETIKNISAITNQPIDQPVPDNNQ